MPPQTCCHTLTTHAHDDAPLCAHDALLSFSFDVLDPRERRAYAAQWLDLASIPVWRRHVSIYAIFAASDSISLLVRCSQCCRRRLFPRLPARGHRPDPSPLFDVHDASTAASTFCIPSHTASIRYSGFPRAARPLTRPATSIAVLNVFHALSGASPPRPDPFLPPDRCARHVAAALSIFDQDFAPAIPTMPLARPLCFDLPDGPNTLPQPALSRLRRRHHQPHASPPLPSTSGVPDHRCRYSGHIPQRSPPYFDAFDASSEASAGTGLDLAAGLVGGTVRSIDALNAMPLPSPF
ncbi:hypothetical protein B0H15DRAFT_955858 [Mycena belliarum]|uniref:Uncharacterized protein n=1 Tax=Mycena belliarum TaxID=1033014 RepID=A0AAD6TVH0_9AGAR|nr:hypothetical protein B0H15DRAFT_955830 [Mycena belliae]KAJ7076179.1 hypothetical protein B0H15DRAFT_955858 [Mycena belliae]